MPVQLLFELDDIDLSEVAVSAERVGQINPQGGHMRHLDHMIWTNDDATCGLGVKSVGLDEFWIAGHIPGRPLLPGVLQIEACGQLCSVLQHLRNPDLNAFLGFTRCTDVSFRGAVVPGDTLLLLARELKSGRRRFVCKAQGVVNGSIVMEATITGMVL